MVEQEIPGTSFEAKIFLVLGICIYLYIYISIYLLFSRHKHLKNMRSLGHADLADCSCGFCRRRSGPRGHGAGGVWRRLICVVEHLRMVGGDGIKVRPVAKELL